MNHYAVFEIGYSHAGLTITSSHIDTLESVLGEVKKLLPSAETYSSGKLTSGERYKVSISDPGGNNFGLAWWIIQHLCDAGWEPFAYQWDRPDYTYSLRVALE